MEPLLQATLRLSPLEATVIGGAILAQLIPVAALVRAPRPVATPRLWVAAWALVYFLSDVAAIAVTKTGSTNLWLYLVTAPLEDACLLMGLSYWQTRPLVRLAIRVGIPIFVIALIALALAADEVDSVKAVSAPFRSVVILSVALYTLISRTADEPTRLTQVDWFWICIGVAMNYGLAVATEPIAGALLKTSWSAARLVYVAKAAGDIIAFILIAWGIQCGRRTAPSGST